MMGTSMKVLIVGSALVMAACTSGRQPVEVEQGQQPTNNRSQDGLAGDQNGNNGSNSSIDGRTTLPLAITKKQLAPYALDLANLSYKFSYLATNQADKITFDAAGKAQLQFKNLEAGKAGTLTLEILEGTTVKLRGVAENVTLTKGQNNQVALTLKNVDAGNNGGSTDLTIDVTLDDGILPPTTVTPPTTVVTPPTTVTPPTDPVVTPPTNVTPPTDPVVTTPPTVDPIAEWDGKSFRGNARWSIVPVEG
jgi:hypothetical protein